MVNPFGKMANIMQQAKSMQQKFKQAQEEMAVIQITGEAGAGLIKLTINGNGEALNISIDPSVYSESQQILQGLILAAINDANHKRELKKKEMMTSFMSGMGLPSDMDFLNMAGN